MGPWGKARQVPSPPATWEKGPWPASAISPSTDVHAEAGSKYLPAFSMTFLSCAILSWQVYQFDLLYNKTLPNSMAFKTISLFPGSTGQQFGLSLARGLSSALSHNWLILAGLSMHLWPTRELPMAGWMVTVFPKYLGILWLFSVWSFTCPSWRSSAAYRVSRAASQQALLLNTTQVFAWVAIGQSKSYGWLCQRMKIKIQAA